MSNFEYLNDDDIDQEDMDYTLEYHDIIPTSNFIDIHEYN